MHHSLSLLLKPVFFILYAFTDSEGFGGFIRKFRSWSLHRFCTTARICLCDYPQSLSTYRDIQIYKHTYPMYRKIFPRWEAFKALKDNIKSRFKFISVLTDSAWKMLDSSFCLTETMFYHSYMGFPVAKNYIGGLIPQDQEYHWRIGSWTNAVQPATVLRIHKLYIWCHPVHLGQF